MDDLQVLQNQFNGGIMTDDYIGNPWGFYDGENIDIYSSSQTLKASKFYPEDVINKRVNGKVVAMSNINANVYTADGYIENLDMSTELPWSGWQLKDQPFVFLADEGIVNALHTYTYKTPTGIITDPNILIKKNWKIDVIKGNYAIGDSRIEQIPGDERLAGSGRTKESGGIRHTAGTSMLSITERKFELGTACYVAFSFMYREYESGSISVRLRYYKTGSSTITSLTMSAQLSGRSGVYNSMAAYGVDTNKDIRVDIIPTTDFVWKVVDTKLFIADPGEGYIKLNAYTLNIDARYPMFMTRNLLSIGHWGTVSRLRYDGDTMSLIADNAELILWSEYEIVGVLPQGDQVIIYANLANTGKKIYRDGTSDNYSYEYTWDNMIFTNVKTFGGYDYVTVKEWVRTALYVSSWPNGELVLQSEYDWPALRSDRPKHIYRDQSKLSLHRDILVNSMEMWNGVLLLPDLFWGVLAYGTRKPGFPRIISRIFSPKEVNAEIGITCIRQNASWLYLFYRNQNWETVYVREGWGYRPNFVNEYSLTFPPIIGNHLLEKEINSLLLSYMLPTSECSFELYARVNDYLFWSFEITGEVAIQKGDTYRLSTSLHQNYVLIFEQQIWNRLEFRLEGDALLWYSSVSSPTLQRITGTGTETIPVKDRDNFKQVWIITTDQFVHTTESFQNIQVDANLPDFQKIQFKLVAKGTRYAMPELYSFYLPLTQTALW